MGAGDDCTVREEAETDAAAIRTLHRAAFEGEAEATLVDALHDSGDVRVSLVADEAGAILGHVLFSELTITSEDGTTYSALALAPLAVHPDRQRQGIGSLLVRESLQRCRDAGWRLVIVVGAAAYYGRFGFTAETAARLQSAYAGEHFLGLDLQPDPGQFYCGSVRYPEPFAAL